MMGEYDDNTTLTPTNTPYWIAGTVLATIVILALFFALDLSGERAEREKLSTEIHTFRAQAWKEASHQAVEGHFLEPYYQGRFDLSLEQVDSCNQSGLCWGHGWTDYQNIHQDITEMFRVQVKRVADGDPMKITYERAKRASHILYQIGLLIDQEDDKEPVELRQEFNWLQAQFREIVPE